MSRSRYSPSSLSLNDKWNDGFDNLYEDGDSNDGVDLLEKAQDVASHFGKYSVEEIEHIRDDLHDHRIQRVMTTRHGRGRVSDDYNGFLEATENDELILEKFLEDDLTSQLLMLKGELSDSSRDNPLFPEYNENNGGGAAVAAVAAADVPEIG